MDDETRILTTTPKPPPAGQRGACLVHIYPSGPNLGSRYTLGDTPLVVGRDDTSDIRINDHSVSRRHARIQPGFRGLLRRRPAKHQRHLRQRRARVSMHKLKDGDYLRVRQLHLPLPGRRQRRGRISRGNLPPDHHRRPDRHPQQALLHRVPRPRFVALDSVSPAAGACHVRHRPLQVGQR